MLVRRSVQIGGSGSVQIITDPDVHILPDLKTLQRNQFCGSVIISFVSGSPCICTVVLIYGSGSYLDMFVVISYTGNRLPNWYRSKSLNNIKCWTLWNFLNLWLFVRIHIWIRTRIRNNRIKDSYPGGQLIRDLPAPNRFVIAVIILSLKDFCKKLSLIRAKAGVGWSPAPPTRDPLCHGYRASSPGWPVSTWRMIIKVGKSRSHESWWPVSMCYWSKETIKPVWIQVLEPSILSLN